MSQKFNVVQRGEIPANIFSNKNRLQSIINNYSEFYSFEK